MTSTNSRKQNGSSKSEHLVKSYEVTHIKIYNLVGISSFFKSVKIVELATVGQCWLGERKYELYVQENNIQPKGYLLSTIVKI